MRHRQAYGVCKNVEHLLVLNRAGRQFSSELSVVEPPALYAGNSCPYITHTGCLGVESHELRLNERGGPPLATSMQAVNLKHQGGVRGQIRLDLNQRCLDID